MSQGIEHLIDTRTGPYSPIADIEAEIVEIELLPKGEMRDMTIRTMKDWIERRKADPA